nr:HAD hydrolase-like protein [Bacteroidota bacterium]
MKKLFIWDFHGTLEKGNEYDAVELSNMALEEFGYKERINIKQANGLYGLSWYKYFEHVLPNESNERHLDIVQKALEIENRDFSIARKHTKPNDHAHEVLKIIERAGHDQILISSTYPSSLTNFVAWVKMEKYFPKEKLFYAGRHKDIPLFTKQERAMEYMKDKKFDHIIIIGDSPKDISVVGGPNVTSYLYTHPEKQFRDGSNPTYRIRDLREVLKEL